MTGDEPPDFDEPFAILEACHERIARMLRILERLPAHVAARGVDAEAREAVGRVLRYFDEAGPDHHADEEADLFPAVRAAGDPALVACVDALQAEHRAMEAAWARLGAHLRALLEHGGAVDAALAGGFAALYREHVAREEGVAFPAAKACLAAAVRARLAAAMVARRRR
jgi:hemerythrin-like domain-containing protein